MNEKMNKFNGIPLANHFAAQCLYKMNLMNIIYIFIYKVIKELT